MTALCELSAVSVERDGKPVLGDISFSVHPGEAISLSGPSGCGKTTLLNVIAGLVEPSSGRVERRFERLGFAFQDDVLLPWKTARDNIALAMRASGVAGPRAREMAERLLEELGVGEAATMLPAALSGGMRQRVNVARALSVKPQLLLLDEAFSALDRDAADRVKAIILREQKASGFAMVEVAHDAEDLVAPSARTIVLPSLSRVN